LKKVSLKNLNLPEVKSQIENDGNCSSERINKTVSDSKVEDKTFSSTNISQRLLYRYWLKTIGENTQTLFFFPFSYFYFLSILLYIFNLLYFLF
jgi:hypothetical protein